MNWKPRKRTEQLYAQELIAFFERLINRSIAEGIPIELLDAADFIATFARQVATRMITALYFAGAKTWREAALQSSKGLQIRRALRHELRGPVGDRVRELISENANLISSLPSSVAASAARRAAAQQYAGGRPSELVPPLLRHTARVRARLIARTEVSKASAALTESRSEMLGLPWYVWRGSLDERERLSHRKMESVLIRFSDPPAPEALVGMKSQGHYNAGGIYNCRCYEETLVRYEQVQWPHTVYTGGMIQRMSLSAFKRLNSTQEIAA